MHLSLEGIVCGCMCVRVCVHARAHVCVCVICFLHLTVFFNSLRLIRVTVDHLLSLLSLSTFHITLTESHCVECFSETLVYNKRPVMVQN